MSVTIVYKDGSAETTPEMKDFAEEAADAEKRILQALKDGQQPIVARSDDGTIYDPTIVVTLTPRAEPRNQVEEIRSLFHTLWTKAVHQNGYSKEEWKKVRDIFRLRTGIEL